MGNGEIAEIFDGIADMLELEGDANPFELKAYRKAAQAVGMMQESVAEIFQKRGEEGLMEIPGIGKGLAGKIKEYLKTGKVKKYAELKKKYPFDIAGLTRVQGLGPKRALRLHKELGIVGTADLRQAIAEHRVRELNGFGGKSEAEISKSLSMLESGKGRMLLGSALPEAERIALMITRSGLAQRVEIAGSTRRMRETVGDLDILVASKKPAQVMDFIGTMGGVERVLLRGPTKSTVRLAVGLNCDIRIVGEECFGAAIQYFIGSKAHNVKTRLIAAKKGYKLNEYGLFKKTGGKIAGENEREIYARLGLDYVEPEMREDRGEVELASSHGTFRLVQDGDIKGDLHLHTKHSDGLSGVSEMTEHAVRIGRKYIGFTDHSKAERVANGMDEKRFEAYLKDIESARRKYDGTIEILKSAETDILKDGSLDFGRKALDGMDYVLAAVHTNTNMKKEEMTMRIVRCIESNKIDILAHPTGRIINRRPPIDADWDRIFEAAKDHGVAMEIDSFPERLDLNDESILRAREYGLKFAVDTDSHATGHMQLMRYGVGTAKRGWLKKEDIINTRDFNALRSFFT